MSDAILEVDGLQKSFDDIHAVRAVSFHINEGETYGLLGPNGAGKTTSISMIAGLLERDAGTVTIDSRRIDVTSVDEKRAIGLVPQELAIYPDLSARENLAFFARLYDLSGSEAKNRIAEVLSVIGLTDRADDLAKEYSGGMQRRLNIGIGLLHRPRLLILDEPTVGVDPQSRNAILESVERLSQEGMAVLYTTHYMEEAERLCDRVGIIDEGEIKAEGTRRELVQMVGEKDKVRIGANTALEEAAAAATLVPGVVKASVEDHAITLLAEDAAAILPDLLARITAAGTSITGVTVEEPNLEAVFLHVTGKALRD
ncbi:MAG: ABC transporter ATP-binding protein [Acidimicrobiia bacterium]|nr:ABC transporter ATP-binding protein [Acidimicrobiia bacterium]